MIYGLSVFPLPDSREILKPPPSSAALFPSASHPSPVTSSLIGVPQGTSTGMVSRSASLWRLKTLGLYLAKHASDSITEKNELVDYK